MKKILKTNLPVLFLSVLSAFGFFPVCSQNKSEARGVQEKKEEVNIMKDSELLLKMTGGTASPANKPLRGSAAGTGYPRRDEKSTFFRLGDPVPVSREVYFTPRAKAPNCFFLPPAGSRTFEYRDQFVGDVGRGGSCNVDILSYVPHGLTHLETSAHILAPDESSVYVKDLPAANLCGAAFLVDLTHIEVEPGRSIEWRDIEPAVKKIKLPVSMLAIKTKASRLPAEYDFSGKDFLFLSSRAAQKLHDMEPRIDCLLLDLPSIDRESDGGKLSAHRHFFGLPASGHKGSDGEKRALVELAYFAGLKEGYYYVFITPQRFQANAVSTGIIFFPLEPFAL